VGFVQGRLSCIMSASPSLRAAEELAAADRVAAAGPGAITGGGDQAAAPPAVTDSPALRATGLLVVAAVVCIARAWLACAGMMLDGMLPVKPSRGFAEDCTRS